MTTLIAVFNAEGKCVQRCDAKCYDAQDDKCTCVCHGRNHGAGRKQAIENTRELAESWVEEYARKNGIQVEKVHLAEEVQQMELF